MDVGGKINAQLVTNGNMASTIVTSPVNLEKLSSLSFQVTFSGSPNGSMLLQSSNNGSTWTSITNTIRTITAAGDIMYPIAEFDVHYIRVAWVPTSGSGTMNVYAFGSGE